MALNMKEYTLDAAAVEAVSADLQAYLKTLGADRLNVHRLRLSVEEILLNVMAKCGESTRIRIGIGKQFGQHIFRMQYAGASFDPTQSGEEDWSRRLMVGLGYYPCWNYRGGVNTVSLKLEERAKRSTVFCIAVAVLAAVLLGVIGNHFPENLRRTLTEALLAPVSNGFLGLMGTFSGVMIAFTMCSSILNVGDTMTLGRVGRYTISRFVVLSLLLCAVTAAVVIPVLQLNLAANAGEGSSQLVQISRMVFAILPTNPVESFMTGNTLQIVVIAMIAGVGLLMIGERGSRIQRLVHEGSVLTQHLVTGICRLVPLFVFAMLLQQIWTGQLQILLTAWKPVLLIAGVELLIAAALWLLTSFRLKCPAILLLKKALPPFMVAFTTASSLSAMPLSMKTCTEKLGVRESTVSFAYPLGSVIYMSASIASFTVVALTFASICEVNVNLTWVLRAVFTVTMLVIAMPPIPGAGLLVYTVLFAQLGIPSDALVLATAIDVVVDYCNTGFNVLLLILQVAWQGKTLGCIDHEVLVKKNPAPAQGA